MFTLAVLVTDLAGLNEMVNETVSSGKSGEVEGVVMWKAPVLEPPFRWTARLLKVVAPLLVTWIVTCSVEPGDTLPKSMRLPAGKGSAVPCKGWPSTERSLPVTMAVSSGPVVPRAMVLLSDSAT